MNFLAHALLAAPDPGLIVGGVTADFIKGRARHTLPEPIREGIALHRRIDAFTDTHPLVAQASALLEDRWDRYAPVLVDIFFDHVLANDFAQHSATPLPEFTQHVYGLLLRHRPVLPDRAVLAVTLMAADDWMTGYATIAGIRRTLERLTRRLHHDIDLAPAADDLLAHLPALQAIFREYFPLLREHVRPHSTT